MAHTTLRRDVRPRRPVAAWLSITAVAVLVLASGCAKTDAAGTDAAPAPPRSSGPALAGEPVKVMTITSIDSQGPTAPVIGTVAELYEAYINDHGGIGGRPLDVTVCDDKGSPTTATACARQAVSENMTAVVGSFTFFGTNVLPVLEAASIPWFGVCCTVSAPELSSDISFPIGSAFSSIGEIVQAKADGCQKVSAVIVNGTEAYIPVLENGMKSVGLTFNNKPAVLPLTATDYSSELTQATANGTDCIVTIVNEGLFPPLFAAFRATGSDARIYGLQGNLNAKSIKGFEDITQGSVIAGSYPDISTPAFDTFRTVLKQYDAAPDVTDGGDVDYNSAAALGTWTAYYAFSEVTGSMTGTVDAPSFLAAAAATSDLELEGMAPDIDFTKPWTDGLPGFNRIFNRNVVFQKVEDGKVVPYVTDFTDLTPAVLGQPMPE